MSGLDKRYQVFVSSTYEDLVEERQAVMHALLELDCIPSGMELFPAADDDQWTLIKRVIDDCDYYIVVIAGKCGSIGPTGISYTRMEYEYAVSKNKPVIAFLHKDISQLTGKKLETEDPAKKKLLEEFRVLAQQKMCKYWTNKDELGSVVSRSLVQQIKIKPAVGWVRANLVADESAAQEILKLRRKVEELEKLLPEGTFVRPEIRSTDYFKKLVEKYPRNAIQEAWACLEQAVQYAITTHDLDLQQNFHGNISRLIGHGDLPRNDVEELNQYYLVSEQAKVIPDFKITTTEALVKIEAMLRYARVLVEKCDGVWAVRNDLIVS
jgi:hypothetical protein